MGRPSKKTLWIAGAATALVLVTGVGAAAYAAHYADIGLPRASVAGVSVSGLTHDQIAEAVDARASQAVLTATVSGTWASPSTRRRARTRPWPPTPRSWRA